MLVLQGILSGLIGGILMGAVSEVFYQLGIFKSTIFIIDGSFVTRFMKRRADKMNTYLFGIPVHLLTSTAFGVIYLGGTHILKRDPHSVWIFCTYVAFLWISMLLVALPIAGQGFLGRKGSRFAWIEQIVLHIVYGIGLWFSLTLI
jgi:lysylphosphatidylglycerol synthetase-like protein (DUF2156 family)